MKQSTVILGLAGLIGIPIWLLPDSRQLLGSDVFFGLTALSFAGGILGLVTWFREVNSSKKN